MKKTRVGILLLCSAYLQGVSLPVSLGLWKGKAAFWLSSCENSKVQILQKFSEASWLWNEENDNCIKVSPFSTRIVLIFGSMPKYILLQKYRSSYISTKLWCTACLLLYFKPFLKQGAVTLSSLRAFRSSSSVCLHLTSVLIWKTGGGQPGSRWKRFRSISCLWQYWISQPWERGECYRLNRFIRRSVLRQALNKSSWCLGFLESCSNSYLGA